jgi:hypothetical protein
MCGVEIIAGSEECVWQMWRASLADHDGLHGFFRRRRAWAFGEVVESRGFRVTLDISLIWRPLGQIAQYLFTTNFMGRDRN